MSINKIIVLAAPPANGKSTMARRLVAENKSCVIVNRDDIRSARGDYWIPEQEDYISDIEEFEVKAAIRRGLTPIVDATNLNPKTREKWAKIAQEMDAEIEWKEWVIPLKEAIERDSAPERIENGRVVGEKVLKNFYGKYYPEMLREYYKEEREYAPHNSEKLDCIIVDVDGTLCLNGGRPWYGDVDYSVDTPNMPVVDLINILGRSYHIIVVSGREDTENGRKLTNEWLHKYIHIPFDLFMRGRGDYRGDSIVKEEIYKGFIKPFYNVVAAFDDRNSVVNMWRSNKLLCCQVANGNF